MFNATLEVLITINVITVVFFTRIFLRFISYNFYAFETATFLASFKALGSRQESQFIIIIGVTGIYRQIAVARRNLLVIPINVPMISPMLRRIS